MNWRYLAAMSIGSLVGFVGAEVRHIPASRRAAITLSRAKEQSTDWMNYASECEKEIEELRKQLEAQ